MPALTLKELFTSALRKALVHLYDPGVLRYNPLIQLFQIDHQSDMSSALRDRLNKAIESLRPGSSIPPDSNAWRLYQILNYRYTEQSPQSEVASDLSLSIRQLRRQEKLALELLADYLWNEYQIIEEKAFAILSKAEFEKPMVESRMPNREEELAWIHRTTAFETFDIVEVILEILKILRPIFDERRLTVQFIQSNNSTLVIGKPTTIRQAIVNLLSVATFYGTDGQVVISVNPEDKRGYHHIHICVVTEKRHTIENKMMENLRIAGGLIELSNGYLFLKHDLGGNMPFSADIYLQNMEKIRVYALDDNTDTLELLKRFLSDSRYQFTGSPNPEEFFTLVSTGTPDLIILDVMLPGIDGWEIIRRLRENPKTHDIPVIISTILQQEQLALALGATEFIHKPINREKLLLLLDRLVSPEEKE